MLQRSCVEDKQLYNYIYSLSVLCLEYIIEFQLLTAMRIRMRMRLRMRMRKRMRMLVAAADDVSGDDGDGDGDVDGEVRKEQEERNCIRFCLIPSTHHYGSWLQ